MPAPFGGEGARYASLGQPHQIFEFDGVDLARPFDMSLNAVSKHIKVLEQADLEQRRVSGREHWLSLRSGPLEAAYAWIGRYQRFWESGIDALERYLMERKIDVE